MKKVRRAAFTALKLIALVLAVDLVAGVIGLTIADWSKEPLYYRQYKPCVFGHMNEAVKDYVGELHVVKLFTTDMKHVAIKMKRGKVKVSAAVREDANQFPGAMDRTLLLNGFSFSYRENPHRVSLLEASVDGIAAGKNPGEISAKGYTAFEGGDWSRVDGASYQIGVRPVEASAPSFAHRSEKFEMVGGRARKDLRIDLAAAGLGSFPRVAVALRGFRFNTKKGIPDGLNLKGIAVRVTPGARVGNTLELELTTELKGGEVAFRKSPGYFYRTDVEVFYTLIGTGGGESVVRTGAGYMMLNRERAPREVQLVQAHMPPGPGVVVPVIEGFEFDIHTTKARFIRGLELSLDDAKYDALTGMASVYCNGYLSNDGTWAGALDVRFAADLAFVKLDGGAAVTPVLYKGTISDVTKTSSFGIRTKM